jgi:hypothetical protein
MAKRGSDADSRIFFDELVSLTKSRLRAAGAIRLEDRQASPIPFSKTVGHCPISSAQSVGKEPKGFGSSTTRHAA